MCLVRGFAISAGEDVFTVTNVGYLVLSSTLGIIVGDVLWLEALRLLGAKHVIVIDSLKPFAAAILGRLGLDEILKAPAWGGMVLTVIGVGVVAWEEQRTTPMQENGSNETNIAQTVEAKHRIGFSNDGEDIVHPDTAVELSDENIGNTEEHSSCNSKQQLSTEATNIDSNIMERKQYRRGYLCAIVNVLADSLGSLLTKKHGVGMTTWSINLIRFGFAGVVMISISVIMRFRQQNSKSNESIIEPKGEIECGDTAIQNETPKNAAANEQTPPQWFELPSTLTRMGWLQITAGVGLVTFLCPTLSNYALFQITLGLAVALGSIGPLYGLFFDWPFKGRRPTLYGCVGVLLAIAGVVILCVWGS